MAMYLGPEGEVEEPRPGHLDGGAEVVELDLLEQLGRHLARRRAEPLGQAHGHVDLVVAELGPL